MIIEARVPLKVDEKEEFARKKRAKEVKGDDEVSDDGDDSPGEFD